MKTFAAILAAGVATSVSAQPELNICVEEVTQGSWTITAELMNAPAGLLAVVSDLGFVMNGADFANFAYNSAFDGFFGPATVTATATQVDFLGTNTLPPLGTPDASNPLSIGSFDASSVDSFALVGQVTGAFDTGGMFAEILTYQDALGNAGDTAFNISIKPIPAPASAALLGLGGLAAIRRRR